MLFSKFILSLLSLSSLGLAQSQDTNLDDTFLYSSTNFGGIQLFPIDNAWSTNVPTDANRRYNSTLHSSSTSGSRFVYFFQGDSIYWYGDKGPGGGAAYVSLDAQALETVNTTASTTSYQQVLWSKTGLGGGDHQLVISHADDKQAGPITLDYLRVVSPSGSIIPSKVGPGSSTVPAGAVVVDNANANNMISYDGGWEPVRGSDPISGPEGFFYMNTVHRTTTPGATLSFKFTGTGVWYFSDKDTTHGFVKISLDGGVAEDVSGYNDPHLAQQLIWGKIGLSYQEHTVTVSHSGTPAQYSTLDYFMYLPTGATSSNSPSGDAGHGSNNAAPRSSANELGKSFVCMVGLLIFRECISVW